ncbi:hypothetical protein [Flavobacterium sp. 22076]|uniref:hypothetical protein n=1 Tax=unclassified Flavobacterium TaxID=196869 RepID=UPI003F87361F
MKKTLILLFSFFVNLIHSQNKAENYTLTQKKIEPCRISINDSVSIFKVHEKLKNIDFDVLIKTENIVTQKCLDQKIGNEIKNAINTNQNTIFKINDKIIKDLRNSNFSNLIPNKISLIEKGNFKVLIFETYNFSYSTVGNGYINFCFKIDSKGKTINQKILESKLPMEVKKYRDFFRG